MNDRTEVRGLPTWFKGCVYEARNRVSAGNPASSYDVAGAHLGIHRASCSPEGDELRLEQELVNLDEEDLGEVADWLRSNFSEFMRVVPKRRHEIFARGFIRTARS